LIETLTKCLQPVLEPLAADEQGRLYSDFDLIAEHDGVFGTGKTAAVLVPLVWRASGWQVLLTLRSDTMPTHAGQISFPGGSYHPQDENLTTTALREFEEETGVLRSQVRVLGRFERYHTATDYRITPFVGVIAGPVVLRADPREVAEIFEVPFSFLSNLANFKQESRIWQGKERFFYSIPWQDRYIWGATAGMLRALALRLSTNISEK